MQPRELLTLFEYNYTHHRSELARYLTNCGYSPGDLMLLDYLNTVRTVR